MKRWLNWCKDNPLFIACVCWLVVMIIWWFQIEFIQEPEIVYETVYQTVYEEVSVHTEALCERPEAFYQQIVESMTENEYHLLAALIKEEAGGESFTGQRAVAEVVLNRVLHPAWPDTITEVIYQPNQFSVAGRLDSSNPTQEQYDAVTATLRCVEPVLLPDVLFFASVKMNRPLYETIGGHNFYYRAE